MQISLRKAAALQVAINDAVKALNLAHEVTINEFQDAETEISRVATEFKTSLDRRQALLSTLYEIRSAVANANHSAEINDRLAAVARLEKDIQFFNGFASKAVRQSAEVVEGKLNKLRNRKEESRSSLYGYNDTVDTTVFTREDLDGFRRTVAAAKKAKQKLQDELLEANVRTQIELGAVAETVLKQEGLI